MKIRIAGAILVGLVFVAAVACGDTTPSPAPTQPPAEVGPTPQPTAPSSPAGEVEPTPSQPTTPKTATVTGTVTYRERIALSPGAVVEVKLSDVSRADAPAVTIGEQIIDNPGQVPIAFEIEYDPEEIDERFTYAVQVRIIEGDKLAFINDTVYNVITRDNPAHVDMVLVKVGAAPSEPTPSEPAMVEVLAPIESVNVVVSESAPTEYTLQIVSGLPGGCVEFKGYVKSREGNTFTIGAVNLEPAAPVPCTAIYGRHEGEVVLGDNLTPGETYTVVVNGEVTNSFLARDERTIGWVTETSPIETVEVAVSDSEPPQYSLNVVSRLPEGSSCSVFNGYDLRRSVGRIEVTVTHVAVAPGQIVPCTADLPVVSTEVPLGTELVAGETYAVAVNGEVTNSFLARDERTTGWVVETSPIESVEVVVSDSEPPRYSLNVISRLPRGSSCSAFNGYDISRPLANAIHVRVTHLEVAGQNVPCTRDLPVVATEIPLGINFIADEQYSVIVNGKVTETFTAKTLAFEVGPCRMTRAAQLPIEFEYKGTVPGHVPSSGVRVRHPVDRGLCHCLR